MKKLTETRVNLTGVILYDVHVDPTTKAESLVPRVNPETSEYLTEDANRIIESSKAYKEIFERHAKNGWPAPTIVRHQTFEYSEVEDINEVVPYFVTLGLDATVAAKKAADIFQRGWAIAQQQEVYAFMNSADPEVEGALSVAADAAQPGERRQKDPMATAAASLKKAGFDISAADLKALLASMQAPA